MQPSEDERVLAALAHASIVANVVNLAGIIATVVIWAMQRDRSAYVRGHALQSLVYQGGVLLFSIFLGLFWGLCVALSLLPVVLRPDLYRNSLPGYTVWLAVLGVTTLITFGVVATLYGLYGAFQVYRGRPFRYPLAGRLARRAFDPVAGEARTPQPQAPASPVGEPAPAPPAPVVEPPPALVEPPATTAASEPPAPPPDEDA
ncbi:MAG TPA: DUF4870 domain-containing protein [Roseiflexaceae bacterium]